MTLGLRDMVCRRIILGALLCVGPEGLEKPDEIVMTSVCKISRLEMNPVRVKRNAFPYDIAYFLQVLLCV